MYIKFVHLHLHTDYSIGDSTCNLNKYNSEKPDLVKMAQKYDMPAIAITDHNYIGGAINFYKTMNSFGIKPIIGCEIEVFSSIDKFREKAFHLVLLAKDFTGYQNLCMLVSIANSNGKNGIDKGILSSNSKGLIGLSSCIQGEIPYFLLNDEIEEARSALDDYTNILGKDNFYIELMDHGLKTQTIINSRLLRLSKELNISPVATNNVHYLCRGNALIRDTYKYIVGKSRNNNSLLSMLTEELYFKSGIEMYKYFDYIPEALANSVEIAERCNLHIPFVPESNHCPVYNIQSGITQKEFLKNICFENVKIKYGFNPKNIDLDINKKLILNRLNLEMTVIDNEKKINSFLILWDIRNFAREQKIPIGPGRGSLVGSIIAYLLEISEIDPIKHNLNFEIFFNSKEFKSFDVDIDVCDRKRETLINYIINKYGKNHTAFMGTYGKLKTKFIVKKVQEQFGDLLNNKEIDNSGKFSKNKPIVMSTLKSITDFKGLNQCKSIHAAGILLGDISINEVIPISKNHENKYITQFVSDECKMLGFLKLNILGLKTLSLLNDTIKTLQKNKNIKLDLNRISVEDEVTFSLFKKGDLDGIFLFSTEEAKKASKKLNIEKFEDIVDFIALFRSGVLKNMVEYIKRKKQRKSVHYLDQKIKEVLGETLGMILYQEQVIQLIHKLTGISLTEADNYRKGINKGTAHFLEFYKTKFTKGCIEFSSIGEEKANLIWNHIATHSNLSYSKAHAVAYALIAYRTAYLKANYFNEFNWIFRET